MEDPSGPMCVEAAEAEAALPQSPENDSRSQKTKIHDEDVHPDAATQRECRESTKHDDRQDCDSAQAVDGLAL